MKTIKVLTINFFFFLVCALILELFFGGWLKKNNFGYSVRELRNVNIPINVKLNQKEYNYFFKRNNLGFIGKDVNPENIKVIFLGGSTGEEMFKPPKYRIVDLINAKLSQDSINIEIINASKAGKSTRGYVSDFKNWFVKIENLRPKIVIFYLGINDSNINLPKYFDETDKENFFEKFEDYFKNNSTLYSIKKKIQNKFFEKKRIYYGLEKENLYANFKYINYDDAKLLYENKELNFENENVLNNFSQNLNNLDKYIVKNDFVPMFITQIKFNGVSDYNLYLINQYLKKFCDEKKYSVIKLDELAKDFLKGDFYDEYHTTIDGSLKISDLIYSELKNLLIKNLN